MIATIISASIVISIVLLAASMSGFVSERAGIVNIAINGMMIMGALVYAIMRKYWGATAGYQIPAILITAVAVGLFSMLHAFATITLKADHVISGTAINILASGIALFMIKTVFKEPTGSIKSKFDYLGVQEKWDGYFNWFTFSFVFVIVLVIFFWWLFRFTKFGLRVKASGENPQALASQGVSVFKIRYIAVLISGMLAGLAGALYAQSQPTFYGNVEGLGFIGVAILICGQWRIPFMVIASVLFGTLNGIATSQHSQIPVFFQENRDLIAALPFVLSIMALVLTSKRSRAPKAVGLTYDKSKR